MATSSTYKFKTYTLSEKDIQKLAYVAKREQGSETGARAELSLMANLYESRGSKYKSITDYVLNSGWFAKTSTGSTTSDKKWTKLVVDVLVKGNRTLPPQINEHDWKGDLLKVSTGDGSVNKNSNYIPLKTVVYQNPARFGGSAGHWTFYCFPTKGSDPFGTTNPKKLAEWLKKYGVEGELYYKSSTIAGVSDVSDSELSGSSGPAALVVHADKLYSSDNYEYAQSKKEKSAYEKRKEEMQNALKADVKKLFEDNEEAKKAFGTQILVAVKDVVLNYLSAEYGKSEPIKSSTLVQGTPNTSVLPVVSTLVEAPMFEVNIANATFGGYHNKQIPNYVKSITITKTNGSINQYNIQLIHQISPGDNPNYIDNLLSKEKYNTIGIKYGDAASGKYFSDSKALITDVTQVFDFTNCNIIYNVSAVSITASFQANKYNFDAFTGKISDRIEDLLYNETNDLLDRFPGMKNQLQMEKEGLIPHDDAVVTVGAVNNVTTLEYIYTMVPMMIKDTEVKNKFANDGSFEVGKTAYTISISDDTLGAKFQIKEVIANLSEIPFMYEVNIGYPDDNFALDFSVNDNFAWPLMYEGAKQIVRYDYELDSIGNLTVQRVPAFYKETENELGYRNLWTSLTRFPVSATLTVRGLLQDSLLLQYIKINSVMYGSKRITSGVYIVTEQVDSIGNGVYNTQLSLTRVAGDDEYINLNGRYRTHDMTPVSTSITYYKPPVSNVKNETQTGKNWADGSAPGVERPLTK